MTYDNPVYPVENFKLCGNRLRFTDERGYVYGVYALTDEQLIELRKQIDESLWESSIALKNEIEEDLRR